ncbi:hypothetical protein LXL04_033070 [Taraxacum kok-saghyz]
MNEGDSMEVSRDGRTLEEARKLVEQRFRNYVGSNAMVVAQEELDWHLDAFKAGFEIESQSDIKDHSMYYVYVWLNRCLIIYLNHILFVSYCTVADKTSHRGHIRQLHRGIFKY